MLYKKINLELIVFEADAAAVIADLNTAIDRLEDGHTIFGGGIEAVAVAHRKTRKRSALRHTLAAGDTAVASLRMAGGKVAGALKAVI
jgi:O-acetylhomoserine/O-acetylserine sulfhydrylase-like pyridoxal-dependent enzyme